MAGSDQGMDGKGGRTGTPSLRAAMTAAAQNKPRTRPVSRSRSTSKKHGRVGRPGIVGIWTALGETPVRAAAACEHGRQPSAVGCVLSVNRTAATYLAHQRVQEAGTHAGANVTDGDRETWRGERTGGGGATRSGRLCE